MARTHLSQWVLESRKNKVPKSKTLSRVPLLPSDLNPRDLGNSTEKLVYQIRNTEKKKIRLIINNKITNGRNENVVKYTFCWED